MLTICLYVIGGVLCFDTSFSLPNSNRDLRFPNCRSDLLIATYCCRPSNRNILLMGCGKHYSNARFISQGEVAIGRSLLQGRCQERVAIGGSWHLWRKSRSGDRSYRGGVRREVAIGGSWHQGEVAIGRSLLQGRCQRRESPLGRSCASLLQGRCSPLGEASGGSRDREIAPTGEVSGERGRHWGKLASGGSRDREIAPTGEVSGESRHWGKHQGEVAIGRSLLQGRCQERGRHWGKLASGGSRDREIAPTGEVSGESRHRGKLASGGSRDREIAPTGEVSGESRHWGKLASGGSRDREIAPTENLTEKRILRYSI